MNRFWILGMACVASIAVACSSNDTKDGGTGMDSGDTDTGAGTDAGGKDTGAQDSSMQDTGTQDTGVQDTGVDGGLNGCLDVNFVDKTQGGRTVTWGPFPTVTPHCMIISKTQTVTWQTTGNETFQNHPLNAFGGDANNPIMGNGCGAVMSCPVVFPNTGDYGFDCGIHGTSMMGVIRVKN
jgi:hypothetical protein